MQKSQMPGSLDMDVLTASASAGAREVQVDPTENNYAFIRTAKSRRLFMNSFNEHYTDKEYITS